MPGLRPSPQTSLSTDGSRPSRLPAPARHTPALPTTAAPLPRRPDTSTGSLHVPGAPEPRGHRVPLVLTGALFSFPDASSSQPESPRI